MVSLAEQILDYERTKGKHQYGSFVPDVFRALAHALPTRVSCSIETGTGLSTILLSNISDRHFVFTIDDRQAKGSSVQQVVDCPLLRADKIEFVFGPTQRTLPAYDFNRHFDIALLDGPHAYPFPELEYFFIYRQLSEGALLILDDIHIPTIGHMFKVLREDRMFEPVSVIRTTAILRRTAAPLFDPFGDGWWDQEYNIKRVKRPSKRLLSLLRAVGLYRPARSLYRRFRPLIR